MNQELASLQGETTFGSIRTDTNKFHKFKANLLNNNNSTSNIKDNLTISNYNEDEKYERHYYTPDHYDDDSFNDIKDNRYSYSSIHSDENSKYFDNEQPRKRFKSLNINKIKGMGLNKGNAKNKVFEYSPTIEMDKQSRGNSTKRNNNNINESQNDRINNLSIININKSALDEPEDIFDRKKIEEMTYEKYINNYSKDLRIVKNNKIFLKNDEEKLLNKKKLRPKLEVTENEVIELKAKEKSDEQKMKEIFDNKKLFEKMRAKLEKENAKKYRHNNITGEEGTSVPNIDNRYKLLKNLKKTKENNITINQGKKREIIFKESNENNFEIKSEYYYIETKDSDLPEIIEKQIKESNIINQQIIKNENEFKENKTILSNETNFNIEGKKINKFEDIESNELSIISKQKKLKKRNEIKKNEEIKINAQPKKWNISKDLNLISNDEFSLIKKEKTISENKNKENELYIENNELQIIDIIRKNKNNEKIEKIIKRFDIITPSQNQEILINNEKNKKDEKIRQLFKYLFHIII